MITVSYSRISTYLNCQQEHYFKYVERLRPKKVVRPLSFGSDFHKLLQYRGTDQLDTAKQAIIDKYNALSGKAQEDLGADYLSELFTVFQDYQAHWSGIQLAQQTEVEFEIPVGRYKGEDVVFVGVIDEIYENGDIGEHKTFNYAPDMSVLAMNIQPCLYAKARHLETGVLPTNIKWDYTKSAPAQAPIWLEKSNRFSTASNSKVTHLSWQRACDERGLDQDDPQRDLAEQYRANIANFFFRCDFRIVPEMVETSWNTYKAVVRDIIVKGGVNTTKNIGRHCTYCDFQPICFAQFTGANAQYTINRDYYKQEEE